MLKEVLNSKRGLGSVRSAFDFDKKGHLVFSVNIDRIVIAGFSELVSAVDVTVIDVCTGVDENRLAFIEKLETESVCMTMCDGKVLYENGEYKTIDAEKTQAPEATATQKAEVTAAPKENTLRTAVGAPETVQDSFDGPAVGAQLYIQMDAVVEMPNVSKVPVLRGRVGYEPEKAAERIAKVLLGDGPYLRPGHSERAYNQLMMEYYQKWIEALDQKPYGPAADYDQLRENLQQNFDANAEGFRNADTKYDRPSQPWTGSFSDAIEGGISISNGERSFGMVAGNTHLDLGMKRRNGTCRTPQTLRTLWAAPR